MANTMIECQEVTGKTVRRLILNEQESGSQEVHIEFTDDTAFTVTIEPKTVRNAGLNRQTESGVEVIRDYTL